MSFSILHLYDTADFRKVGLSTRGNSGGRDAGGYVDEILPRMMQYGPAVRVRQRVT